MTKKVWALVYGVDGFGADIAPALEEGIFLSKEEALEHCISLNLEQLENNEITVYEEGWGEDSWDKSTNDGKIIEELFQNDDFDNPLWDEIFDKHCLNKRDGAKALAIREQPALGFYCIQETFIH